MASAVSPPSDGDLKKESKPTLTPPASEEADKHNDSGSDLSDLEAESEDNGEVLPDHYYDGGRIPVFKPTMAQFRSFKHFIEKIDKYGMKSGIVKVIPPDAWRDSLPPLDEQVKTIKVKNPITQEFHGTHGTYTQANIEKQRSYNLPQWKALSEESNHQPPARRGERRRNQEKSVRDGPTRARTQPVALAPGKKRGPGRPRVRPLPTTVHQHSEEPEEDEADLKAQIPPTPTSPPPKSLRMKKEKTSDNEDCSPSKTKGRQPKSVSTRRQHNRRDLADVIDEEAFKGFDYRIHNQAEWTKERCTELETAYWKSLTFNNPLYGADMPGSLFDNSTESWNVAKLENLLDVLGQKVPGVNTAYLYLGMWKASFAWHLEDVDLYSINYIHFGAPKQWYSISQEDARRFEAAMRNVWPNDAKNCDQFLRHKTYLISPQLLQSQYNIRVNRLVHHEGEFVITFPYGYHSGYNLGYNCAESVNFATESWLDFGKLARKCNCEADSVWIDVGDIERKLRGDQTPEYYEETEEEEEEEEDDVEGPSDLPTPPGSVKGKPKAKAQKRKREVGSKDPKPKVKRLRIKIKVPAVEPCVLCPNDFIYEELLSTEDGRRAHRRCALYTPETYISEEGGTDRIFDIARIDKARLELKCNYCRNKRGAVFQCSQRKCIRAYHATCAAQAGVQVDMGLVPVYLDDGTEYTDVGIDFRCRFHRVKRPKQMDGFALEENALIRRQAPRISVGELVQVQYFQGDIFAGLVLENRRSENMLLVKVLPNGDELEVEYKWVLIFDHANSQLPVPSENAKPLPAHLAHKSRITTQEPSDSPKVDEPFGDAQSKFTWSEFNTCKLVKNPSQVKVDVSKPKQLWFYLGKTSTEAKAQYTENLAVLRNNPDANFLDSVRAASAAAAVQLQRRPNPPPYPAGVNIHAMNAARARVPPQEAKVPVKPPYNNTKKRPYNGKYAITEPVPQVYKPRVDTQALQNQRAFQQSTVHSLPQFPNSSINRAPPVVQRNPVLPVALATSRAPTAPMAPMAPMMTAKHPKPPRPTTKQHQKQPSNSSRPSPQAPVANMMGGSSNMMMSRTTLSKPPPFSQPSPTVPSTPPIRSPSVGPCDPIVAKYPYLLAAHKSRPKVYQSPYLCGGGFTTAYLPNAAVPKPEHTRNRSLSEDFLLKRSLSQQELLKTHKRQESESKQPLPAPSPARPPQPDQVYSYRHPSSAAHKSTTMLHSAVPGGQTHHHTTASYFPPQQYQHDPSPAFFNPLYQSPSSLYDPSSSSLHHQSAGAGSGSGSGGDSLGIGSSGGGLQFQSPHDFQMQMQREAQHQEWSKSQGGFDQFFKGLQKVAVNNGMNNINNNNPGGGSGMGIGLGIGSGGIGSGNGVGGVVGGGSGSGTSTQGSPLKYEMGGGGGEMLPMMGDRFS